MAMENNDVIYVRSNKASARAEEERPEDMSSPAILAKLKQLLASQRWGVQDGPETTAGALSAALDAKLSDSPTLSHRIKAAIHMGVPIWNSGDFAGCAALYRAVASTHRAEHPALDEAVRECDGAPVTSAGHSQGWIIRRAFDSILVSSERAAAAAVAKQTKSAAAAVAATKQTKPAAAAVPKQTKQEEKSSAEEQLARVLAGEKQEQEKDDTPLVSAADAMARCANCLVCFHPEQLFVKVCALM
jgi:hypothetical protein